MDSTEDPIQLFVPTYRVEETLAEIRVCLEKGWTGLGFKTVELEKEWCQYTGLAHSHFVNSATVGLQLALRVLKENFNWKKGDEVITTPLTFVSTNHVILQEELAPVFADVDKYACLDPIDLEKKITKKTRAVMFVGLGGNTGQLKEVSRICKERGIKLILDAAHMAGTRWKDGSHVGGEADVTVFSFQAVKNLPTADSGMICFSEETFDTEVRKWSWLGINKDTFSRTNSQGSYKWMYDVEHVGFKAHGNSIMAAMGLVGLRYLEQDNSYRRQISSWYEESLGAIHGIQMVKIHDDCTSSRHLFQVVLENRDEVMLALNNAGIFPGVHYRNNTVYRMYSDQKGVCPNAEYLSDHLISLPLHMRLTFHDVKKITDALRDILLGIGNSIEKNNTTTGYLLTSGLSGRVAEARDSVAKIVDNPKKVRSSEKISVKRPRNSKNKSKAGRDMSSGRA